MKKIFLTLAIIAGVFYGCSTCKTSCMDINCKDIEDTYDFAGKASDVIRCAIDNGDTTVINIMRSMVPEIEEQLPGYAYCY